MIFLLKKVDSDILNFADFLFYGDFSHILLFPIFSGKLKAWSDAAEIYDMTIL